MNQRCTALHMACIWDAPIDIILSLVYIYDDACLMQNVDGRTPLSFACECASDEIILLLIKACPKAVFIKDNNGSLPICDALWFGKGLHTVELLLQIYPSSATSPNVHGTSALDEFFREGIFNYKDMHRVIDVSNLLLQASTNSCKFNPNASERDRPWNILHASIKEPRVSWAFTVFFFEKHSYQIKEKDEDGNIPLHLLCYSSKPFNDKVFDTFFKAFPRALSLKNNMGLTPLDIALLCKHIRRDENLIQPGSETSSNEKVVDNQGHPDGEDEELVQINSIFWLLLKDPSVVGQFGSN